MNHRSETDSAQVASEWLIGGGEMGALVRTMDWPSTPLGSRAAWPACLRTAINMVLAGSFPMAILWGSDSCCIYNDAYRVIAGEKHPAAMGRSTRDVWPEAWSFNQPIFAKVMTHGETIHLEDHLFPITRTGAPGQAYFTMSYSPIYAEDGQVGGTLVMLLETTPRIRASGNGRSRTSPTVSGPKRRCGRASRNFAPWQRPYRRSFGPPGLMVGTSISINNGWITPA